MLRQRYSYALMLAQLGQGSVLRSRLLVLFQRSSQTSPEANFTATKLTKFEIFPRRIGQKRTKSKSLREQGIIRGIHRSLSRKSSIACVIWYNIQFRLLFPCAKLIHISKASRNYQKLLTLVSSRLSSITLNQSKSVL